VGGTESGGEESVKNLEKRPEAGGYIIEGESSLYESEQEQAARKVENGSQ